MRLDTAPAKAMEVEPAIVESPASTCNRQAVRISSAVPVSDHVSSSHSVIKALVFGLGVTAVQIVMAVLLLAPEGPLSYRYSTLNQHDSYWFMNIIERGYATTVPPINHKVMEVANVAFFPAYPALAALVRYAFHVGTDDALLIAAQAAAWGFWSYFFLLCERWSLPPKLQMLGAAAILAHPAAFFLIAGYSESLFMMSLLGFVYWSAAKHTTGKIWAVLHGMAMSATRIVGIPCALIPLVHSALRNGWRSFRAHTPALLISMLSMLGGGLFFLYCQLRWGHWDMYMLTQSAGWGITPDYLAAFRPSSYRWLLPALNNPTQASQLAMTSGGVLLLIASIGELLPALRRRTNPAQRIGIYFAAVIIYYVSVSGVACVDMESMLRYEFCVHALIVLALLGFLREFRVPPLPIRAVATAAVVLACAAGLSVQGWYVWNFTRGNWVA